MSDDFSGDFGGHEGGDLSAGHQDFDLDHTHAAQGADHDSFTDFNHLNETHAQESDEHFANFHQVEATDGHGATFAETDATEFDAHNASFDNVNAESFTNEEHDSNFSELDHLREQFEADYLHSSDGPELGESGHGELTAR